MDFDKFDYDKLTLYLKELSDGFPSLYVTSLGKSIMGREIWCAKVGKGYKKILIISCHHALEWITSALSVSFLKDFLISVKNDMTFMGYDSRKIYTDAEFFVIPMLNPDGADIVINSIGKSHPYYELITSIVPKDKISQYWQSDIRGVDLNHNYDCRFSEGVKLAETKGIYSPHYTRYSGTHPFSEPETIAIKNLCESINFHSALAFHTQGEVIYPGESKDKWYNLLSKSLADVSGYQLSMPEGVADCSGFKDWAMEKTSLPSFTIEFGMGKNPLPFSQFEKMKNPCYNIIVELSKH